MAPIVLCLSLAFLVRLSLIMYGEWQDRTVVVKFTDVDYHVFTDAAQYVYMGESPYIRSTYRYTPILAYLLIPNILLNHMFGKLVFSLCDILTGYLIFKILKKIGYSKQQATIYCSLWLFNPLPITVSARGNAESVMTMLVLMTLLLLLQKYVILSAIMYGITIHLKIYPVTYVLAIYFHLSHPILKSDDIKKIIIKLFMPNKERLKFSVLSVSSLTILNCIFYYWYGWKFIYESYIYHIVRNDICHNFSPYFYLLYLTVEQHSMFWIKLVIFLPQVSLLLFLSVKFYTDLPLSWFLITFAFVTANKVCTSQYFLWYLSLLPLVIPSLQISMKKTVVLVLLWFAGQAVWLQPAYLLEFKSQNTFVWITLAGLLFFTINCLIIYNIIEHYKPLSPVPNVISKKNK